MGKTLIPLIHREETSGPSPFPQATPTHPSQRSLERRQAVQSTTELTVSVASLFKFISVGSEPDFANLKNFFVTCLLRKKKKKVDIALT